MTETGGSGAEAGHGLAPSIEADRIDFALGAVGMARAHELEIAQAGVGLALADEATLRQSSARVLLARESVRLELSAAASVVANHVDVGPRTAVAVLVARSVEGDVRPLLDWRGAVAFGAAFGLVAALFGGRRRARD